MKGIPPVIINSLIKDGFICERCKAPFKEEGIKAVGVRMSKKNPLQQTLFVEYRCDCKDSVSIEFQSMSLMDFAMMVLHSFDEGLAVMVEEELAGNPMYSIKKESITPDVNPITNAIPKKNKPRDSMITKKEIDETVNYLGQVKYFDDVLESMGIYNRDPKKTAKKRGDKDEQ